VAIRATHVASGREIGLDRADEPGEQLEGRKGAAGGSGLSSCKVRA
jgi:hypothetical protein